MWWSKIACSVVLKRASAILARDRHADGVADALPERAGRRLDAARRVRQLRMTGRLRAELPEALHLVERHVARSR